MKKIYKKYHLSSLLLSSFFFLFFGCAGEGVLEVPDKLIDREKTKLISGAEAIKIINKMHGLEVAPDLNVIAEYGNGEIDLLYISFYEKEENVKASFDLMIQKLVQAEEGPFSHIRALPDYDDIVYMALGMGAIHYIYYTSHYIIWLQTYQDVGRELPAELLKIYPI